MGKSPINVKITLKGIESSNVAKATKTVLTSANAFDENSFAYPKKVHLNYFFFLSFISYYILTSNIYYFMLVLYTQIVPKRNPLKSGSTEINDILPPVSFTVFDLLKIN